MGLKGAVQSVLGLFGYELRRVGMHGNGGPTLQDALARLQRRGPGFFRTVIDIGASDGRWSAELIPRFPQAQYLLVEAQAVHEPGLKAFCARHPQASYVLAAAGESDGEIHFDATDPFSGVASPEPFPENDIVVPVTKIDTQVQQRTLPGPFLIKFDTHGFEIPILRGAAETLKQTSVVIMECYNFPMAPPESLLFHAMCQHMESLGFRCVDLIDVTFRAYDSALWQMDLIFIRADDPTFSRDGYHG